VTEIASGKVARDGSATPRKLLEPPDDGTKFEPAA
jgi:hypothetical protein